MLPTKKGMELEFIVKLIILIIFLLAAGALFFVLSGQGEGLMQKLVNLF